MDSRFAAETGEKTIESRFSPRADTKGGPITFDSGKVSQRFHGNFMRGSRDRAKLLP
jgi:hypothetical protein